MQKIRTATPGHAPSGPFRLGELVAFQEDAVVSHQLLRDDGGNVSVFASASGQGLSEHTAPFDALVQILEGSADVTVSGERHRLSVGEAIVLPAGRPHALDAATPFKMAPTMIRTSRSDRPS